MGLVWTERMWLRMWKRQQPPGMMVLLVKSLQIKRLFSCKTEPTERLNGSITMFQKVSIL
ncbi:hypothetical protein PC41400_13800 [Paenibacillus chitinolyticus]|uniref:Uncharacterized protein n=1 Tax=Paenibacillus chitinolyticus TaxID=79263 RepID=A0A410WWF2_9BACL|nr:hypothetical protein PC41400_13800 [Paenibacillus chitinolyticus]